MTLSNPFRLDGLSSIAHQYDALICDLWGVVHDGVSPYPGAIEALVRYRQGGGSIVFLSNAPRPGNAIAKHLAHMGVVEDARDAIVSSGDLTRRALIAGDAGKKLFHIGPERDLTIFEGLDVTLTDFEAAQAIVCSGFANDETQTPDDYSAILTAGAARGMPMICANPDRQVMRADRIIPCAGTVADAYEALGGQVTWLGKPYAPAYDRSREVLMELRGSKLDPDRILCIGDGLLTDIPGANQQGLPVLLITGGLHAPDFSDTASDPGDNDVVQVLDSRGLSATMHAPRLVW
jgi:HAD superfamily hydrolase (TIGR01459 family)